jgi:malate dehydrogenase (oxaloacetate-decarboxylating)
VPSAHPAGEVASWSPSGDGIGLADVVANAEPTMLIGTSTQPAAFTEQLVRQMASKAQRPIIMPLSNPTSKCEALPQDLIRWTEGRALVATGSPFPPVTYEGHTYRIAQANNALIFPGLGLGVAVAKASRITEPMLEAAADAVADLSDAMPRGGAPATGGEPAYGLRRGRCRRCPGGREGRPGQSRPQLPGATGPPGHVAARIPQIEPI